MAWKSLLWLCLMTLLGEQLSGHPLVPENTVQPSVSDSAAHYPQVSNDRMTAVKSLMDAIERVFPAELSLRAIGRQPCHKLALSHSLPDHQLLSRDLVAVALTLALGVLRCRTEALPHILELYEDLGDAEANDLFLEILKHAESNLHLLFTDKAPRLVGTSSRKEPVALDKAPALMYNVEQLAGSYREFGFGPSSYRCAGLTQVNGSTLVGTVHSHHASLSQAASECQRLGAKCGGVDFNTTGTFQVLAREGSYFLSKPGAFSWLQPCEHAHRSMRRRSPPDHCHNDQEQEIHNVMQWMPLASTYYNLGTTVYYAVQNCTELAKERAIDTVVDLGYDAIVSLTGGATSLVGYGVAAGLKPGLKATVQAVFDYFRRTDESKQ